MRLSRNRCDHEPAIWFAGEKPVTRPRRQNVLAGTRRVGGKIDRYVRRRPIGIASKASGASPLAG